VDHAGGKISALRVWVLLSLHSVVLGDQKGCCQNQVLALEGLEVKQVQQSRGRREVDEG